MDEDTYDFLLAADPQEAFELSLTADLDQFTPSAPASRLERDTDWRIPETDLAALRRWGVAQVPDPRPAHRVQLAGEVQRGTEPEIAVEEGRSRRAYALGTYWHMRIGALEESGTVLGVREAEDASASGDAVVFINGSLTAFLEVSWRWAWASAALRSLPGTEYGLLFENLERFRSLVRVLDPVTSSDPRFVFWDGIVDGW